MFDMNYYGSQEDMKEALKAQGVEDNAPMPDLCHKCGRCCKSATTYHSYKKLQELAELGNKNAQEFLSVFIPFESIEEARKVVPEQVEQVIKVVEQREDMSLEELTFYHCPHVTEEGLCGIYERRPACCRDAPGHGWSAMPPGCGFEGWQFLEREKQKRLIRDMKGTAYTLEQLSPDGVQHPTRPESTVADMWEAVNEKIKPWKPFGADKW